MRKFTFKINKETGRCRSFYPDQCDIKLKKKCVGSITQRSLSTSWYFSFMIKKEVTKEYPAPFKWIFFNKGFETINEAKIFLQEHTEEICNKYDLYEMEN